MNSESAAGEKAKELWIIDPKSHLPEALGLLKEWVSTLLTLQTTLVAALAAFVGFKDATDLKTITTVQGWLLVLAALCSLCSVFGGVYLLNMLPAAAQRRSSEHLLAAPRDLFSIVTSKHEWYDPLGGRSILFLTRWFRVFFLLALLLLVIFAAVRLSGH